MIPDDWFEKFKLISNKTSEHEVRYDAEHARAVKRTWPGHYGQVPFLSGGLVDRRMATPIEYLERLALQNTVFADDFHVEGVTISQKPSIILFEPAGQPSLVISQQWVTAADAEHPTPSSVEIAEYLRSRGFEPAPKSYFGWFRRADGVLIVDAKPDNFLKTQEGIVPIDLQMSSVAPDALNVISAEDLPSLIVSQ